MCVCGLGLWQHPQTHAAQHLQEARARNQRDTTNSLQCQNPAVQSHKRFPWWVSTVRQPMQRLHGSIINSKYAEHGLVWVAYLQPLLSNLLLHWDHCLPTALWGHMWYPIWSYGYSPARSPWIMLANRSTPEVLWRSSRNYICFNRCENYQPGVETWAFLASSRFLKNVFILNNTAFKNYPFQISVGWSLSGSYSGWLYWLTTRGTLRMHTRQEGTY